MKNRGGAIIQPLEMDTTKPMTTNFLTTAMWVAAGGACGALARFSVAMLMPTTGFPWSTLLVNVSGSALAGLVAGLFIGQGWFESFGRPFLVIGMLGAFTTFSTFSMDTLVLFESGNLMHALAYVAANLFGCLAAALLAYRAIGGVL